MYCAHCGTQNIDGAESCDRCGELLLVPDPARPYVLGLKLCPACGSANDPHARFCVSCREPIDGVRVEPQAARAPEPPRRGAPAGRGARTAAPRVPSPPAPRPEARRQPPPAPAVDLRDGSGAADAAANDSGTPGARLPSELAGWNWGAFLLGPVWGVFNRVWIALLPVLFAFLPQSLLLLGLLGLLGFSLLLGARGNEWAWRARRWHDADHFRRAQQSWMTWGLIVMAISVIWVLVAAALGGSGQG